MTKPRPPQTDAPDELLGGLIERVTFHNEGNGFCVLRVKARGHRELVTVVGHAAAVTAGEWITASGMWVTDRDHGQQFKAAFLKTSAPTSLEGIEKYLGSGMIRGIGPVYAKKLVRAFGDQVFTVIEEQPERLAEVEGIGPIRRERMVSAWADQKVIREIMLFLHAHGVGTARAVRIFKTYGTDAVRILSENPYRLARDIQGIGFKTADAIAKKMGIEPQAPMRVRAGIAYALMEARDEGHCGLPREALIPLAEKLLDVPTTAIESAIQEELLDGAIVADRVQDAECVFLASLYRNEQGIAELLHQLRTGPAPWADIAADTAIGWVQKRLGIALAQSQQSAIRMVLREKVALITGGPGVGKTTLVNAILNILDAKRLRIALAAPTGRAAKRMSETTGKEAKTIHRLLEIDPQGGGFKRKEDYPLDIDLLVLDECSMIDVPLMHAILRALPRSAGLLMVGDPDQLPSVGPGQVLADLIAAKTLPVVHLTEVFRQAAQSRIIQAAHRIHTGHIPDLSKPEGQSDFYFIAVDDPAEAADKLVKLVTTHIPRRFGLDPVQDIQVLCPMNRGALGARALNDALQAALNGESAPVVEKFGRRFAPGDKVMQIQNDYEKEVFNGDLGTVHAVDMEEGTLTVDFEGRIVAYGFGELDLLQPAYAITVHKSQGSEYPAVVIPMSTQHYPMLKRNLLYTAVTRGKALVVLLGQKKAVAMAARNGSERRRWSKLREWMR
ncbi:MAG: ATP-dependent RecD-like DNA helicase [Acidithiobacillus caldus]|uniref:SF1B family DNA helicase RecD2 n=1 Tax=Acidithiobacillus caldus TaxID=33059 RepID=UPI0028155CBF|nr:ATP-dependent RecD-like DNA helicase [Acidithiobacillus caldus]WMT47787.1 MAG: ATP-dependent RecD-like DNA helicase [Acidithiobacillus caldus]